MFVQKFALLLLAVTMVAAGESAWVEFCDDAACSVNCGQSVSVDNPGCLNESGRQSMSVHGLNLQDVALVVSPAPDCPCQADCVGNILTGNDYAYSAFKPCFDLTSYPYAQSFRFIGGFMANPSNDGYICDTNNCPAPSNPGGSTTDPSNGGNSASKYDGGPPPSTGDSYGKYDAAPPSTGNSYSAYDSPNASPYDGASGNSGQGTGDYSSSGGNSGSSSGNSGGNSGGSSSAGAGYGGYGSSGY